MAWLGNIFGGGGTAATGGTEFVGQYVDIGQQKLRIKKVIAEGGYGFVFIAQDSSSGKDYALKRLMSSDESSNKEIVREISFLRKLRGHPNIIQYIAAAAGGEKQSTGLKEYLILTELCTGQLIQYLNSKPQISLNVCLQIFGQTCKAVAHMHKQNPPIIHRDLKIENLLISDKGVIKLCDFGSATTDALYPDDSWSALQRSMAEDEIQRNTTPMYRAPEMVDLYSNSSITVKADVWALGCVLYVLCFTRHPFEDSAKLKIMNANYTIPEFDRTFQSIHHLIKSMLQVNPDKRPSVEDIHAEIVALAADRQIDLKSPIMEQVSPTQVTTPEQEGTPVGSSFNVNSSQILGNVVNKAGSLFSNIKDVSTKMMSSVAGYVNKDLDISYITPRLVVMSFPADGIEGTYKNNIDDVRMYLDTKHPESYVVINISQRTYRTAKLNDRVYELGWNPKRAPPLDKLVSLCRKLNNFLKQSKKNVVVVHCLDGRMASALMVSSFLLFTKLFTKVSMAEDLFNNKRFHLQQYQQQQQQNQQNSTTSPTPPQTVELLPSQRRYAGYVGRLVGTPRYLPHKNVVFLKSFTMSTVPIFNKARTGCRPFIEIYEGDKRILSTAQEVEQMREYTQHDGKILFNTHIKICGDITIQVHHGRSTLGGKVQGKLTSINILTVQFHTGFLDKETPTIKFAMSQLDIQESADKYPPSFGVVMNLKVTNETPDNTYTEPWEKMNVEKLSPYGCFYSREEYWKLYEEYGLSEEKTPLSTKRSTSSVSDSDNVDLPAGFKSGPPLRPKAPSPASSQAKANGSVSIEPITTHTQDIPSKNDVANDQGGFSSLIDIGTPSPAHNAKEPFSDFQQQDVFNNQNIKPSNNKVDQEQLIDPFASLATSRTEGDGSSNNDVLLNFGSSQPTTPSTTQQPLFQTGPDILNTNSEMTQSNTPDLLQSGHFMGGLSSPTATSGASTASNSLNDINSDDFFSRLGEPAASPQVAPSSKFGAAGSPFMGSHSPSKQSGPRKSNSESNLLEMGDSFSQGDTLQPEMQPAMHHASSSGAVNNPQQTSYDPFGDFGNFGSSSAQSNSASNLFSGGGMASARSSSARSSPTFNKNPTSTTRPQQQQQRPTATQQSRQSTAPNYNVFVSNKQDSVFGKGTTTPTGSGTWGSKPMKNNDFSDILNAQGFTSANKQSATGQTLKQMKNEAETVEMDPVKRAVREWSDGKERNIRALISSLQSILWEEAKQKWKPIGLHDIMQGNKVKTYYRKACLAVHPDKHMGTENEQLARAIFLELNEAMTLFEEKGSQNMF
ncbi:cyclin-G-associated kinase-like [Clytia hemisphaerica]|uniref:Auxilin n=1 Tax=Clytia hemisphaerica TaxID=252671 RepID=A0A7M5WR56_9CNID